ncbi:MAG TPA: hypothetical protein VF698_04515, partial [Thermoanaerobaculia bacterium]
YARLALARPDCQDAAEIREVLDSLDEAPPEWLAALDEFALAPSLTRWRDLMRFVPEDLLYQRIRNSIKRLRDRNVDPDVLFLCACDTGMTPDAIALVEEGLVSVETIVKRSKKAGGAKTTYLGLAAIAAFLRGDMADCIRLLRESIAHQTALVAAFPHIAFIEENATPEQRAALEQAGIKARF